MTRVALIHALAESVEPARAAFNREWPEAFVFDLLETSLSADLAESRKLNLTIHQRLSDLANYAANTDGCSGETAGILFTCSAFGPAIDRVKTELSIPVLRPNESAFHEALEQGQSIGLIVTFAPSAAPLESELREMASTTGKRIEVTTVCVDAALAALKAGDADLHDQLVAEAQLGLVNVDVVVLGQFSLARSAGAVKAAGFAGRVITTPAAAVRELRQCIEISAAGATT